ncbi:uncharacterized protein CLUP02_17296 [Colletotrichum lupini]|uniref:Uncharacterized protein n=1 Tax=Colletotrichum lupini TaxID=145971 RepID=A0A9Q8W9M6_9PEZI|nr:uncharacterized protein CLUP02_17296 [Colletotrichum lupini]UQC75788.1 hypothetical protein CLUP02_17296 [Colletotrichum lupini]
MAMSIVNQALNGSKRCELVKTAVGGAGHGGSWLHYLIRGRQHLSNQLRRSAWLIGSPRVRNSTLRKISPARFHYAVRTYKLRRGWRAANRTFSRSHRLLLAHISHRSVNVWTAEYGYLEQCTLTDHKSPSLQVSTSYGYGTISIKGNSCDTMPLLWRGVFYLTRKSCPTAHALAISKLPALSPSSPCPPVLQKTFAKVLGERLAGMHEIRLDATRCDPEKLFHHTQLYQDHALRIHAIGRKQSHCTYSTSVAPFNVDLALPCRLEVLTRRVEQTSAASPRLLPMYEPTYTVYACVPPYYAAEKESNCCETLATDRSYPRVCRVSPLTLSPFSFTPSYLTSAGHSPAGAHSHLLGDEGDPWENLAG